MLSLPYAFGTTIPTIPVTIPYLHPDIADVRRWEIRLAEGDRTGGQTSGQASGQASLRVGVAWAANPQHGIAQLRFLGRERSLDPALLRPLLALPGARFFSLQKDVRPPRDLPLVDLLATVPDMADTAALIANLDLVISVDTAIAHLAAALGKPTWLLDRFNHDWRWLAGTNVSPWYPSLRIYRQAVAGRWKPVMARVAADLRTLCATPHRPARPLDPRDL